MSLPALNDLVIWKEIPQDWKRVRLKFVARFAYGDSLPSDHREEGGFPVYGSNGIVGYHNFTNTLSPAIIVGRKGSFGKVTYSESPSFAIDTTYFIDSRYSRQSLRWLYYALHTLELDKNSQDTGVPGLSREKAYEYYLGLPPHNVQQAIASFLDRKTAAIATLIAKKQRLIQLLEEKRIALINQAVTKGLNPNVQMKDSGIPWIGEIPEHWNLAPLKWIARTDSGSTPTSTNQSDYYQDGEILWIRTLDLNNDEVWDTEIKITPKALKETACKIILGTVMVAMYGGSGTIGKHGILKVSATTNQAVCGIVFNEGFYPDFMHYYVQFYRPHWMIDAVGTRRDPNISQEIIRNLGIVCPPFDEQIEIARCLKNKTEEIKKLVSGIEKSVEKLQEYRQSLITAAVTGN